MDKFYSRGRQLWEFDSRISSVGNLDRKITLLLTRNLPRTSSLPPSTLVPRDPIESWSDESQDFFFTFHFTKGVPEGERTFSWHCEKISKGTREGVKVKEKRPREMKRRSARWRVAKETKDSYLSVKREIDRERERERQLARPTAYGNRSLIIRWFV